MRQFKYIQYLRPLRKSIVLIAVGLHLAGFLAQAAAAQNSCAAMCCCKKMAPGSTAWSGQTPSGVCCSGNSAPTCNLQDDAALDFPKFAVHHLPSPGNRLLSGTIATGLNISGQQPLSKAWRQDIRLPHQRPGPTYLEKSCLLC
jgi:hypothetical protein